MVARVVGWTEERRRWHSRAGAQMVLVSVQTLFQPMWERAEDYEGDGQHGGGAWTEAKGAGAHDQTTRAHRYRQARLELVQVVQVFPQMACYAPDDPAQVERNIHCASRQTIGINMTLVSFGHRCAVGKHRQRCNVESNARDSISTHLELELEDVGTRDCNQVDSYAASCAIYASCCRTLS